jgi:charged multivesicular body protein 4
MLEKREDYIQKQIDEEMRKARSNATTNKRCECR